ncbi:hypothetical protein BV25DRAFT_744153 [Artomyces pyxidatus]|uniref:Uncharacterized protein n=1 Tax=Artomyces pyxidatus TaxID=48021 RepID=A0ACB8SZ47_9AGAM|nr:hypothetical protein BV25DRAFT_744153 [Artomyces pyxidatus]
MSPVPSLPEELLSDILELAAPDSLNALLATNRAFNRISTPFLYHSVVIGTACKASFLTRTLASRPDIARHIRKLECKSASREVAQIVQAVADAGATLRELDVTLDGTWPPQPGVPEPLTREVPWLAIEGGEGDVDGGRAMGRALAALADVRQLRVRRRKACLTQARLQPVLEGLAQGVARWPSLEHATIAFRFGWQAAPESPDGLSLPVALSRARSLQTFQTELPAAWTPAIVTIGTNAALQRIVFTMPRIRTLAPTSGVRATRGAVHEECTRLVWEEHVIPGSDILKWGRRPDAQQWMQDVTRHARLFELIGGMGKMEL